jgi:flagellar assembly protein FliH
MSTSRLHHRRIVRREESVDAPVALLATRLRTVERSQGLSFKEELEQASLRAWQEGYDAATAEFATGQEANRSAQLRRLAEALCNAAERVGETRRESVAVGEVEVVETACLLAEAILERELSQTRAALEAATRALRLVPEGEDLVVKVNPADELTVEDIQDLVPDAVIKVVSDPAVEVGGCVVAAAACRIDAQIGPALQRARRVLEELNLTSSSAAETGER